jgi:3-hydroxyisobutyrate dehydrogenase-like beta-hydroxyacid dehydrogenase
LKPSGDQFESLHRRRRQRGQDDQLEFKERRVTINVGYIGVGMIGKLMAANVMKGGFPLMVYDLRKEALQDMAKLGAKIGASPKEIGQFADVVALSVNDDAQVEEVVLGKNGVLEGAKAGTIIAIHSTIVPETAVKIGKAAKEHGVGVVDAPISGGPEGAAARTMLYMVGGEEAMFQRCKPVFATSGTTIVHMGPLGAGSMTRIVHHVILGLNRFAADEGMKLAQALGLDVATVCRAVSAGEAQSLVVSRYLEKYRDMPASGQYRVAGIAMRMANERGVSLLGPALFQQLYLPTKPKG